MPTPPSENLAAPPATGPLPPNVDPALLDAAQCVAEDCKCVGCGYNVRTLPVTARCPECNQPVADAVRTNGLRYADKQWLADVAGGAAACTVAAAALLACVTITAGSAILEITVWSAGGPGPFSEASLVCLVLPTALVGPLVTLLGIVALTRPEPHLQNARRPGRRRATIRWLLLVVVVSIVLLFLSGAVDELGLLLAIVIAVSTVTICTLVPFHEAGLLDRANDTEGSYRARATGFATPVGAAFGVIILMFSDPAGPSGELPVLALGVIILIAFAAAHAVCHRRLWKLADRILTEAEAAQARVPAAHPQVHDA